MQIFNNIRLYLTSLKDVLKYFIQKERTIENTQNLGSHILRTGVNIAKVYMEGQHFITFSLYNTGIVVMQKVKVKKKKIIILMCSANKRDKIVPFFQMA